ncbi:MAG: TnpV protein [Oscillospiraceae bacterium]|nr:TnpV protein [Oscillospiraceae bacterium]
MTYSQSGDYLLPNITLTEETGELLSKYGIMRMIYLREHRPILYTMLTLQEKLYPHCLEIEITATERLTTIMTDLLKENPPPDKSIDPMAWTVHMNSLKAQAEEIILTELIYD